jgi:subtilase family serine protease
MVFGGTSVSSPSLAGIVHRAGNQRLSSADELTLLYSGLGGANFRDILSGAAGTFTAKSGWDFVTGIGSTLGLAGK